MKHFITFFLLAVAFSSVADAQECKVPISVVLRDSTADRVKVIRDQSWVNFANLLERHGFTTGIKYTRVAIGIVSSEVKEDDAKLKKSTVFEVRFFDSYSGRVFYSAKLDKSYHGTSYGSEDMFNAVLAGSLHELDSLADSIHTCVVNAFEMSTKQMAQIARKYSSKGDHRLALFALVQYPSCCPSYPKIQNVMVATFRDYVERNHDALFEVANGVWENRKTDADARFIVSLLNSVRLDEKERRQADRLLDEIAREYPAVDLKSDVEYTFDATLKEVAIREARAIGIEFGKSDADSATQGYLSEIRKTGSNVDRDDGWYPAVMKGYDKKRDRRIMRNPNDSWKWW